MVQLKITGFDVSYIQIILKNMNIFTSLAYWDRWDLFTPLESFPDKQLFVFVYTHFMFRINSNLTVTVFLELQDKTEANLIIFTTGGNSNLASTASEAGKVCEDNLVKTIKKRAEEEWVIKEIELVE